MSRIQQLDPSQTTGKTAELLGVVKSAFGVTPNLTRVLANSNAALDGFLKFSGALAGGNFSPALREKIALAVAEANLCEYCQSAHAFLGGKLGLADKAILEARNASSGDAKEDAVLKLSRSIVLLRGEVSDADIKDARAAGLNDSDIVETVANVVINIFTNYVNHVAGTEIDFPKINALEVA